MRLSHYVRAAIERRLAAIEGGLRDIEGLVAERRGGALYLRGRGLVKRSIDDVRLRFAGWGR
jgi:hypothetical protein